LVGTVPFLAPELVRNYSNQKVCNNPFKSDVFSLGLCLVYLVTFKKFKSAERLKIDDKIYK
jgi:serine/threonine protein kinase